MQYLRPKRSVREAEPIADLRACGAVCMTVLVLMIGGCGGNSISSSSARAGSIAIAATASTSSSSTSGTTGITSLAIGTTAQLSMTPVNDKSSAGVDWTVTCGGNPTTGSITNGACGTLSPVHTADGGTTVYTAPSQIPINTSVTITATVTSNPAQSSSVSFTIVAPTIGITISVGALTPADTLAINQSVNFVATVTNDPLDAGVVWTATCGSTSLCGSFSSSKYTAPSAVPTDGTVTITATSLTDTTKSASVTLTITEPVTVAVGVNVSPSSVNVETTGSVHSVPLTAIVTNDSAEAGVDWSLSCNATNCGTLNGSTTAHTAKSSAISSEDYLSSVTYVGPSFVPTGKIVTITVKSTTNSTILATSKATVVTAAPIVVTASTAPPGTLATGTQATLVATVANDSNNLGVDWIASCGSSGSCGSFNPTHTASLGTTVYTAPAAVPSGGLVTITASSSAPSTTASNSAIAFTTIVAQPPSLTFSQAPPATMTAAAQSSVSATVTNDVDSDGVSWTVTCGSTLAGGCGWISPVKTASGVAAVYTAPPVTSTGTSVTIVATSVADSSVSISSSAIAITPDTTLSVSFIPSLPARVATNATVNLIAAVAHDTTNAGVDWKVCPSGCGYFTVTPAIAEIPATLTTKDVPAVPAVTATSVSGWANGRPIPYTAPSTPPTSGVVVVEALSHADSTKANSGTITISTTAGGPALNGTVKAGTLPVVGATVGLYAAGTSGYASASSQIATAATDKSGNFTVPAGYTCPSAASQMYLVATGGAVGSYAANANLSLMTALGSCNGLGSNSVIVNEVTTAASAWATAPFAANDELNGNPSYLYLGTSSGNLTGLANAFAEVNNLVDITTGKARFVTPAANAVVPYVEINTLADFLNACTATSGGVEGDGSSCGNLFTAADTLGYVTSYYSGSIAPSDTLQAAFNIAQHPVSDYGYQLDRDKDLFAMATNSSPFEPILTMTPNDWSISLHYTSGGGLTTASTVGSFAIDVSGNLWITDTTAGSVIEWNATGAALSQNCPVDSGTNSSVLANVICNSPAGYSAGGGPIAIDANGNVWVSGNKVLSELTSLGTAVSGSPYLGVTGGGNDMAFDAQDNLWIANGAGVNEFSNLGAELSPSTGFTNSGISGITAIGVDSSNNIWVGNPNSNNQTHANFSELTNPGGELIVSSTPAGGSTWSGVGGPSFLPELAADNAGNVWGIATDGDTVCKTPAYGGKGTVLSETCYSGSFNSQDAEYFFNTARGLALDGNRMVWVASGSAGPSILPISDNSSITGGPTGYLSSSSLAAGPLRVAVDGSGNVWVLLADDTVTEFVGVATPVVTPLALGVKNGKLAAKP